MEKKTRNNWIEKEEEEEREDELNAAIHSLMRKMYTQYCAILHSNRCTTMKILREINTLWRCINSINSNGGSDKNIYEQNK